MLFPVTLDVWHADIYDLDLQTETGDIRAKAFDVFPAVSYAGSVLCVVSKMMVCGHCLIHTRWKKYGKKLQDHFW